MKKLFLIPLLACFTCAMAWAADAHVSNIADLKDAIADASVETIYLDADINYTSTENSSCINILRSVTIDGQGHTLSGYGKRGTTSNFPTIAINQGYTSDVNVVLKDINIISTYRTTANSRYARPVECRGHVESLTLSNVFISVDDPTKVYAQGLTIGGDDSGWAKKTALTIENSKILIGASGYPVVSFNPYTLTATNSTFEGYCGLYLKAASGSVGSVGTVINADACDFNAPNVHTYSGGWNNFGTIVCEDGGIEINLHNCGMNAQEIGDAHQGMFVSYKKTNYLNISGDNSHINGEFVLDSSDWWAYAADGNLTISGGTYSKNPANSISYEDEDGDGNPIVVTVNCVPTGYEVQEIKQGDITLYRVVKKVEEKSPGVLYNLNDAVETTAEGENPVTSFDLSTGTEMKLDEDREVTTAGYVQVKDNGSSQATVVKVGTTATADPTQKVDQTLVINNGLDVQGNSKVEVQAGSTLIVGEGGINTEDPENIVLNVTEDKGASLLLDPTITINKNPELTVKLTVNSKQLSASPWTYVYQRFAIPVMVGVAPAVDYTGSYYEGDALYSYVFQWNGYGWEACSSWTALEPFKGYQLANNAAAAGAVYTFTGQLVGNEDSEYNFPTGGFDFFGNSHLAPIYIDSLLKPYEDQAVEASVWLYNYDSKNFEAITSEEIAEGWAFATEIKPMDGFILNYHGASGTAKMSYESAIWGNPKFDAAIGRPSQQNPAPARRRVEETLNRAIITVTAENGQADKVKLVEKERYSAEFENGSDASKFMLATGLSLYASTEAGDLERVATNDLMGTLMSFRSGEGTTYTLTMSNVLGEDYAIRDNVTGQLIELAEGATYTFTQNAYTSIPARFEIVAAAKMPTAIENVEEAAKATGIYTITGQYLGRDFSNLPSGVYIVNGVKIVK